MIERFNFYDLYGYLIPGVVLILALMAPEFISSQCTSDANEWVVLLAGVAIAYLVGHALQTIAQTALPSSKDPERKPSTYYSVTILGKTDTTFSSDLKDLLSQRAAGLFSIDLGIGKETTDAIAGDRQDAFQLARRLPTKNGYAEQFQGLEVLMRGTVLALWCGAAYSGGFALGPYVEAAQDALTALLVATVVAFLVISAQQLALSDSKERHALSVLAMWLLIAGLAVIGAQIGSRYFSNGQLFLLLSLSIGYVAISLRFLNAYYFFAREFAKAVWLQLGAAQIPKH